MSRGRWIVVLLCGVAITAATVSAQSVARSDYDVGYLGPPLADPMLQHAKETYVLFGCAYCHGLDLVPRGEVPDLRRSLLVGQDQNGNLIGPLLRAGIQQTAKLSPMPQFADLSDQQLTAIARWIHYARQRARYSELIDTTGPAVDAAAGRAYFARACASCHSTTGDLAGLGEKYDPATLRAQVLEPKSLRLEPSYRVDRLRDVRMNAARDRHFSLLENYSLQDVANLVAFLRDAR